MSDRPSRTETYEHTIAGLLSRRAELMTETAELRERMAIVANDIEAVDRVLDSFGYTGDLDGRTARQARIILFYRNELRTFLQRELAKAERPLSTRELAMLLCQTEGKDGKDRRLLADVTKRASKALREMRRQAIVVSQMDSKGAFVWSIRAEVG